MKKWCGFPQKHTTYWKNSYIMLTNPFQTPIQSICRRLPSILDAHLCWPRRRCVITPLRRCCVPFKMGFILLTFTGTSLTLIFHPLHMSILYRCNRKKKTKSHPPFWDFSHREQGSSQWQASAVQKKFTQEGPLSGSLGQWKRPQSKMEVVSWNLIYKNAFTHVFYTHNY